MAAHQVGQRLRPATVGDVEHRQPGPFLHQFAGAPAGLAPAAECDGFGAFLHHGEKFTDVLGRRVRPDRQHHRDFDDPRHRRKIGLRIEGQCFEQVDIGRMRRIRGDEYCIAIRIGPEHGQRGNVAVRPGPVFHDDRHVAYLAHVRGKSAGGAVGRASCGKRHDEGNAPRLKLFS